MIKKLSSFHVDYSKESHLILPFPSLPKDSEVLTDGEGCIFVRSYSYLFAVTDRKDADITPFLENLSLKHFIFPSTSAEGNIRYLMHKKHGMIQGQLNDIDVGELAAFYNETEFYDSDEEYLSERKEAGEYFFTIRDEKNRIISAAYTNKNRRMLVNLATSEKHRGKGYATHLLKNTPSVYLFAETEELRSFYGKRGFETVRKYCVLDRRVDI